MFNKMLIIVFNIDFYSGYRPGSQKLSLSICAHFYHSVIEMGQVLVLELMPPAVKWRGEYYKQFLRMIYEDLAKHEN